MITIYKTDGCPWCEKAIKYIQSKGHEVNIVNCSTDPEYYRKILIEKTRQSSVPVIEINDVTIIGFDRKMIDVALMGED